MKIATALLITVALVTGCGRQIQSPLEEAASRGDLDEIQILLRHGGDANTMGVYGATPLIAAARAGQVSVVRLLLRRGADPDLAAGVNHWPPLMHAVHKAQKGAALALIEGGADINARGGGGDTALIMAAGYGDTGIVEMLLDKGADPRIQSFSGVTALSAAVGGVPDIDKFTVGRCQAATVKALLEKAPDLQLSDGFWSRVSLSLARLSGCSEVLHLISSQRSSDPAR